MCGICGIIDPKSRLEPIYRMNKAQKHRGPNDEGYVFINSSLNRVLSAGGLDTPKSLDLTPVESVDLRGFDIALGNRRLAILDLSPAGHMPMKGSEGSLWLTFNGEIYNYREIRAELISLGHRFRSDSDTEVILAAYNEWGVDCLPHFNGMFAFALWDFRTGSLFCGRDRFGVKPFYYHQNDDLLVFASEIKSILQHGAVNRMPNDQVIFEYLALGLSDHTTSTFFDGIFTLPPGHFFVYHPGDRGIKPIRWWQAEINPSVGAGEVEGNEDVFYEFRELLKDAVRLRLRSDVPVGSALSGGLDSSAIVLLANQIFSTEKVIPRELIGDHQKTFTARYQDGLIDEYKFSNLVTKQTGAQEHVVFPSGPALWNEFDSFVWHLDEPVNSTSQYAQWNVMRLARQNNVIVLLDGQGGDEILAGYYYYLPAYLSQIEKQKGSIAAIKGTLDIVGVGGLPALKTILDNRIQRMPWRLQRMINSLWKDRSTPGTGGSGLQSWQLSEKLVRDYWDLRWKPFSSVDDQGLVGMLYRELTSTNLPKLLRYEDRNSMAFSLETRLPFLDYRLVEKVFSLPLNFRINRGWTKWILRQSMSSLLPKEICWRRTKLGFPTPEVNWFSMGTDFLRTTLNRSRNGLEDRYLQPGTLKKLSAYSDHELVITPGLWRIINLLVWMDLFLLQTRSVAG